MEFPNSTRSARAVTVMVQADDGIRKTAAVRRGPVVAPRAGGRYDLMTMGEQAETAKQARRSFWIGVGVFVLAFVPVVATLDDPGLAWDEAMYLAGGANILEHVRAVFSGNESPVADPWDGQSAHPPFGRMLVALSMGLFEPVVGDYVLAARMVGALAYAGAACLLYALGTLAGRRPVGLAAALAWMLLPRIFGHAHLVALDMPLAFFFLATVYAFLRRPGRVAPAVWAGMLWGLALSVKVNAILLPCFLIPVAFYLDGKAAWRRGVVFLVAGTVVFCALFFPLWQTGPRQILQYLSGGAIRAVAGQGPVRTGVPVAYFGRIFKGHAPWNYHLVMTFATSSILFVAFAVVGLVRGWSAPLRRISMTLAAGLVVSFAASALPPFPKYDGARLVLYVFPMLAWFAGVGVWWTLSRLRRKAFRVACAAVMVAWVAAQIALFHPFELSYYSEAVGGLRGADRLGFDVNYWHEGCNRKVFDFLNANAPQGARVAFFPVGATARLLYPQLGWLRDDIEIVETGSVDGLNDLRAKGIAFVVVNNRRSFLDGTPFGSGVAGLSPVFYNEVPLSGVRPCEVFEVSGSD